MATLSATIAFLAVLVLHGTFLVTGGSDNIKTVCASTKYPEFCGSILSNVTENKTGDKQELTHWALEAAVRIGKEACSTAGSLYLFDYELTSEGADCAVKCYHQLTDAVDSLSKACDKYPNYDAMVAAVRSSLDAAKKTQLEWNCDRCRKGESKKKVDAVSEGNDLGKIIAVLSSLVK